MIVFINTISNRDWQWKLPATDEAQPGMIQYTAIVVGAQGQRRYFGKTFAMEEYETVAPSAVHRLGLETSQQFLDMEIPRLGVGDAMDLSAILTSASLIVAHSAAFHRKMVERSFYLHGIQAAIGAPWFCTMVESKDICKIPPPSGRGGSKWPTLYEAWDHFWPGQAPEIPNVLPDEFDDVTKGGFLHPSMVLEVYREILRHRQLDLPDALR